MSEFNSKNATSTLRHVVQLLDKNKIKYRFLGSVVIAAINVRLHRDLGDLDLIIDADKKSILDAEFKKFGYKPVHGMFSFARKYLALEQLEHKELLGVGYFYGKWKDDGEFMLSNKKINLTIESYAIKGTKYSLQGISFLGIPEQAIATGIYESQINPKRKKEKLILREKNISAFPNNYIHVKIFGVKADWCYHLSMSILNFVGKVRMVAGLPFDPWR